MGFLADKFSRFRNQRYFKQKTLLVIWVWMTKIFAFKFKFLEHFLVRSRGSSYSNLIIQIVWRLDPKVKIKLWKILPVRICLKLIVIQPILLFQTKTACMCSHTLQYQWNSDGSGHRILASRSPQNAHCGRVSDYWLVKLLASKY